MSALPSLHPHPLWDPQLCEDRGYHGPFLRMETYARFPGWEGMGECSACGSCRHVPSEEARRLAATCSEGRTSRETYADDAPILDTPPPGQPQLACFAVSRFPAHL